jgi:hypothetical protein
MKGAHRNAAFTSVLLAIAALGCGSIADDECYYSGLCAFFGTCSADETWNCRALSDDDCIGWRAPDVLEGGLGPCGYDGACTAVDGVCVATSDEDCRNSTYCHETGACGVGDGRCVPNSDEDCRGGQRCGWSGQCSFADGECMASSEEDCVAAANHQQLWSDAPEVVSRCPVENGECSCLQGLQLVP